MQTQSPTKTLADLLRQIAESLPLDNETPGKELRVLANVALSYCWESRPPMFDEHGTKLVDNWSDEEVNRGALVAAADSRVQRIIDGKPTLPGTAVDLIALADRLSPAAAAAAAADKALRPSEAIDMLKLPQETGESAKYKMFAKLLKCVPDADKSKRGKVTCVNLFAWRKIIAALKTSSTKSGEMADAVDELAEREAIKAKIREQKARTGR